MCVPLLGMVACTPPKASTTQETSDAAVEAPEPSSSQTSSSTSRRYPRALEGLIPADAQGMVRLDQGALSWTTWAQVNGASMPGFSWGLWGTLSPDDVTAMGLSLGEPAALVQRDGAVGLLATPKASGEPIEALTAWLNANHQLSVSAREVPLNPPSEQGDASAISDRKAPSEGGGTSQPSDGGAPSPKDDNTAKGTPKDTAQRAPKVDTTPSETLTVLHTGAEGPEGIAAAVLTWRNR
ncbi:MAG: hypothetical protein AAFX99_08545, partial [Myxococcota bacterium]